METKTEVIFEDDDGNLHTTDSKQPEPSNEADREAGFAGAHGSATYDTVHRDNIVCPHCGYEERDSWEVDFGPGLEGETEHQCARCCETMKAERHCTVTYTTAKSPNDTSSATAADRHGGAQGKESNDK